MDLEYNFDEYRLSLYGTKDVLSTGVVSTSFSLDYGGIGGDMMDKEKERGTYPS